MVVEGADMGLSGDERWALIDEISVQTVNPGGYKQTLGDVLG